MIRIEPGTSAPLFSLPDQNGNIFRLEEYNHTENILLYFYPKDETPGCITEACEFRDQINEFIGYNCKVIGISSDSVKSHMKFARHYDLPFTLLSDKKGFVRQQYQVKSSILGLLPGRKTFIIDKKGIISHIFDYQFKAKLHGKKALEALSNDSFS